VTQSRAASRIINKQICPGLFKVKENAFVVLTTLRPTDYPLKNLMIDFREHQPIAFLGDHIPSLREQPFAGD